MSASIPVKVATNTASQISALPSSNRDSNAAAHTDKIDAENKPTGMSIPNLGGRIANGVAFAMKAGTQAMDSGYNYIKPSLPTSCQIPEGPLSSHVQSQVSKFVAQHKPAMEQLAMGAASAVMHGTATMASTMASMTSGLEEVKHKSEMYATNMDNRAKIHANTQTLKELIPGNETLQKTAGSYLAANGVLDLNKSPQIQNHIKNLGTIATNCKTLGEKFSPEQLESMKTDPALQQEMLNEVKALQANGKPREDSKGLDVLFTHMLNNVGPCNDRVKPLLADADKQDELLWRTGRSCTDIVWKA